MHLSNRYGKKNVTTALWPLLEARRAHRGVDVSAAEHKVELLLHS